MLVANTKPGRSQLQMAWRDVIDGCSLWPLWGKLGWNDILQRYRRSLLGPLWLTASMAILVIALGVVYGRIFQISLTDFMPFLCVGLLMWGYISTILTEAGTLFTGAESYIKQIRLPYSVYVYRFIWSKIIILSHNFVIYFAILIYFRIWPGSAAFYAIPGFILLTINGVLVGMSLGMASARFRDIPQIVASVVQILFFITPIMWKPELLQDKGSQLVALNPFFHFVEVVRAPLLGQIPSIENYVVVGSVTILNLLVAGAFFARYRARISYWV
jgi:lipopolysaccharide transport system permease protein